MAHLAVLQKVNDFDKWKQVFDEYAPQRRASGEVSYQIYHVDGDRNNFAVIVEYDSLENAKAWVASDALKEGMEKSGVRGAPTILVLNDGESGKP